VAVRGHTYVTTVRLDPDGNIRLEYQERSAVRARTMIDLIDLQ
jgi:hypothetical protein